MKTLIKSVLALSISSALINQSAHAVSYTIQDLGLVDTVKNTYGVENNIGQAVLSGNTTYNFPVQYDYLDEDDFDDIVRMSINFHDRYYDLFEIDDEAEELLRAGNPDANALSWTTLWLTSGTKNKSASEYQKFGDALVFVFDGNTAISSELQVFDTVFPDTDALTRSTIDVPKGITDDGWIFGSSSAPYLPLPPFLDGDEEEIHFYSEFSARGWVSFDGSTIVELTPLEAKYGGLSSINDININRTAVGTSSIALNETTIENIEAENDYCDDRADDIPFEICVQIQRAQLYYSNAFKWEVDESGTIVNAVDLGIGVVNVHEDDKRPFTGAATSINDEGIIVGYSHFWWDEDETTPKKTERAASMAAVFKDDQIIEFMDRDDYFESRALDINNNGLLTGYMWTYVNGKARTKFFYADANATEMEAFFPTDFFLGSSSYPYAINENNMIVGEGEIEDFIDSPEVRRRRHGFMYDVNNDNFYNINNFLTCEDQAKYVIVEGHSINASNEILGTAWVKSDKLNSQGGTIVNPETGEVVQEDVLRAVFLTPTGEELTQLDCSKELGEKIERSGASFGFMTILTAMALMFRRRRKF
ncbi:hypothetical protein A9Q98_00575 [Thalassotalea sp. 42_200_T64]|nr:hypothetical protein A9Q98_00575 [Thalassotalea sp. 42_200_T64]